MVLVVQEQWLLVKLLEGTIGPISREKQVDISGGLLLRLKVPRWMLQATWSILTMGSRGNCNHANKLSGMPAINTDGISRPTLSLKPVNLRKMLNPPLPDNSLGNLSWLTACTHNSTEKEMELPSFEQKRVGELVSETGAEVYGFTNWLNLGLNEIDFGWGKPIWVGFLGEVHSPFCSITVFKELGKNSAVEAWITLEEEKMSVLENNPEFLAFASPNPSILAVE
ncbi:hypothetical protein SLEP1_g35290 [Rubroshorea leprosula]|uniref:Uncharacterized protein n=1 Tax=Rubroshorea leprosula TaxID=152421 RepID=A0AAV5KMU6_9ROSI|nr:hypothetical protein SLEP1_g35290 [Rubroshorea leprosula]